MGYAELISRLEALPREKQAEVFEFVEFLSARCGTTANNQPSQSEWTEAEFSELSLSQAMRGMEQEVSLYSRDDLQERWQ
jgi:hypothetical protein